MSDKDSFTEDVVEEFSDDVDIDSEDRMNTTIASLVADRRLVYFPVNVCVIVVVLFLIIVAVNFVVLCIQIAILIPVLKQNNEEIYDHFDDKIDDIVKPLEDVVYSIRDTLEPLEGVVYAMSDTLGTMEQVVYSLNTNFQCLALSQGWALDPNFLSCVNNSSL